MEIIKAGESLGVALLTTKHSSTHLAVFLVVAKHKFYTYGLLFEQLTSHFCNEDG